ncbi:MAG: murein biosynthesis integral membrane protein MurJ [Anaerolineales bacterium]
MIDTNTANRQIARAAGVVMAGFVLSNLTGLLRKVLVSNAFGTSGPLDAFIAASRVPDTLFMLVAGGALASAFIPTFTGFLEKDDQEGAWELASAVMNLVSLILAGTSILAAAFAPQLVRTILASNLSPEKQVLTASLLRVLLISPTIFGVSGLLMGILNTHQHFLLPALAPTMHWIGHIIGVLVFVPSMGIHGLAWGAVLGAGLHLAVQLPGLRRLPWKRYALSLPGIWERNRPISVCALRLRSAYARLGLGLPAVREVVRLMGPRVIGTAVIQLNFWVNVILATGMPEGSISAIDLAFSVMMMPQVVVAQAIAIAALPTFSAQEARGQLGEMRASLASTLRGVILLSLPATVGLIVLRQPVIGVLFERGAFDAHSTALVTWALLWYTAGLVSHSVVEIVSRAFYALHNTKTPVMVGAATMGLNVVLSIGFAAWFERAGWMPHGGLALANTVATTLEMFALLALMRRRLGGLEGRRVLLAVAQSGLGAVGMWLGIVSWLGVSGMSEWASAVGGILIGGAIYGASMLVGRGEEAGAVVGARVRRLQRR